MEVIVSQTIYPEFAWETLMIVFSILFVGVVLFALEIFVIPGFGVSGVLGILCLVGGSAYAWIYLGPTYGALIVVSTIVLTVALVIVAMRTQLVKKLLVLDTKLKRGGGVESEDLSLLMGKEGSCKSDLRPAGIAIIENERIDVVSEGGFIDSGSNVRVVAIDGPRVIVAKAD